MKLYPKRNYTEIIRVEIKDLESKMMKSVSFCETTLEEMSEHVKSKLKFKKKGKIKVRINIRISDQVKVWGKQKNFTTNVDSIEKTIDKISKGIKLSDLREKDKNLCYQINRNKKIWALFVVNVIVQMQHVRL